MRTESALSSRWIAVIGLTLAGAAALRVLGLESGLWYDEISTLVRSVRLPIARILAESPGLDAHPLYSVLAHASIGVFGESAWALRLPACLFGIASVWMVFVLGTRMTGRLEAWAGSAVLATSYHHIWFSQNARGYTMLGFFTLLSTFFLIRVRESGRSRDYVLYALACTAGIYTHLTMVLVVAGQAVALMAEWGVNRQSLGPRRMKPVLWALGGAALLSAIAYAPAVPTLLDHFVVQKPLAAAGVATPSWALAETMRLLLSGSGVPATLALGVLTIVGALSLARRSPTSVALLLMPGVVAATAFLSLGQAIRPRYFFFLSGAAAILVGRGLGAVASAVARRWSGVSTEPPVAGVAVGVALVIAAAAVELPRNYQVPKQDFVGAVRFLEIEESSGVRIAAVGLACLPVNQYFGKDAWPCLKSTDDFDAFAAGSPRGLVVSTLGDYLGNRPLRQQLLTSCGVVRTFPGTLGGGDIEVCDPHVKESR